MNKVRLFRDTSCVVVVLYHPKEENINYFISLSNIINIFIVDNTGVLNENIGYKQELNSINNIKYIQLENNMGIAYAQNIGINYAHNSNFDFIFFLDQDTVLDENYFDQMLHDYFKIKILIPKVAAIGPVVINNETNAAYKKKYSSSISNCYLETNEIISSGMLVNTNDLKIIGGFNESLFIDYVDFEWCWRAKKLGYDLCVSKNAKIFHYVGNGVWNFYFFSIVKASPIRYYYKFRNYIILLSKNYVPLKWKIKTFFKHLFSLIFIPIVSKNGVIILSDMFKGIIDGINVYTNKRRYIY